MNEETTNQIQKKSCPYKKILGNICLITILTIFCILEIGVLGLIFFTFLGVYIAILVAGGAYLAYIAIKKITNHYFIKKPTQD